MPHKTKPVAQPVYYIYLYTLRRLKVAQTAQNIQFWNLAQTTFKISSFILVSFKCSYHANKLTCVQHNQEYIRACARAFKQTFFLKYLGVTLTNLLNCSLLERKPFHSLSQAHGSIIFLACYISNFGLKFYTCIYTFRKQLAMFLPTCTKQSYKKAFTSVMLSEYMQQTLFQLFKETVFIALKPFPFLTTKWQTTQQ